MKFPVLLAIAAFAVGAISTPETYQGFPALLSREQAIITELGPHLSPNASIILPGSPEFANATLRWQEYKDPNITIVVKVATESDVQQTVS